MGETGALVLRTASGWEEWRDRELWDYTEQIKKYTHESMNFVQETHAKPGGADATIVGQGD